MIPEIDIWRVANLMLKRYGDQAEAESAIRSAELAEAWRQRRRGGLAAGHRCNCAATELDIAGTSALTDAMMPR